MIQKRIILLLILITTCLIAVNVYAQSAKEHYDLANTCLNQGKYDEAIMHLTEAIQIDPNTAIYYKARGEVYRLKSDLGHAILDYTKAIELNPNDGEVYYFRAISYMFTKDYDKAWDDVYKAQGLEYNVPPSFIKDLQDASGRNK